MKNFLLFFLLCAPTLLFAQVLPSDVLVDFSPRLPGPNQNVSVSASSFALDLATSQISWLVNGVVQQQGVGLDQFSFTTPAAGQSIRVTIRVNPQDGAVVNQDFTITPAFVDLLYQPVSSYVPPQYQGKSLNAHESGVEMIALPYFLNPNGSQVSPNSLNYTWRVDNRIQQSDSGLGKSSFIFLGPSIYRNKTVSVEISTVDGLVRAEQLINLEAQNPFIVFYKNHPLTGLNLARAVSGNNIFFPEPEIEITAIPYFFSDIDDAQSTSFDWSIDGQEFGTVGDRRTINLAKTPGQSGSARVSLQVFNNARLLQLADNDFTVLFGDDAPEVLGGEADYFGESF